ncbi:tetratricopeptide repeat protein [Kiloniella laminariae]|uniref:Tetratricopeptide repeat protein 38 n=1 Tax=Kiloniella laminariae TaxID=454162 RepID=A0ABT4LFN5_9PROT|nr:tetratricopeptide repeat protein [Kiloniella laminariae]MCZ4279904.1 tetratricopeptide repeat protein [Kiloniella laminariae]
MSTASEAARDAYVLGLDRFLGAEPAVEEALSLAIREDEGFVLAHLALARYCQVIGNRAGAKSSLLNAQKIRRSLTERERGQLEIISLLIAGKSNAGYQAARVQLQNYPRDVLVAQACLGVLSLIGLSGEPGREADNLALAEILEPHYGDDWWLQGLLGFAQVEVGQFDRAEKSISKSLQANPRNAHGAHFQSHLYYETGQTEAGYSFITEWQRGYAKEGQMHCHIAWHIALWALARGDIEEMWRVVDRDIDPRGAWGPPLNVMVDLAAVLYRAEMAGVTISPARWQVVCDYAAEKFPKPGFGFVDVHAALAYAMAGQSEALERIIRDARGPAAELVRYLAEAFGAIASRNWSRANDLLTKALWDHARIGGSRAQRDLIEYASVAVLMRLGRHDEARRQLVMHRPRTAMENAVVVT